MAWMEQIKEMTKKSIGAQSHLDGRLGSAEVVLMVVGSLAEEAEQLCDHLQVQVYHPLLQGNPGEVPREIVDCVAGALQRWGGPEDDLLPGVFGLHQAGAVATEQSVFE